ncbi:MAG: DUF72 domain-containing protein [Myxococcota bacterium]
MSEKQLGLFGALPSTKREPEVGCATVDTALTATAARMPELIRLGSSSWTFPGWDGIVYDRPVTPKVLAASGLRAYAQHPVLRTVGIDRTYYRPVEASLFAEMAQATPDSFRFLVKAHQFLTLPRFPHQPRFGERAGSENDLFLHPGYAVSEVVGPFVEGLGERAGPLLFQFPPFAPREVGGPRKFAEKLYRFLIALPKGPLYAVELRTDRLYSDDYRAALREAGAVHCFNSHPTMPPVGEQAQAYQLWERPLVVRWMLARERRYEEAKAAFDPFDQIVVPDPVARAAIASLCIDATARGNPSYVVINNKAEGSAPLSARLLAEQIVMNLRPA